MKNNLYTKKNKQYSVMRMIIRTILIAIVISFIVYLITIYTSALIRFLLIFIVFILVIYFYIKKYSKIENDLINIKITNETLSKNAVSAQNEIDSLKNKIKPLEKRLNVLEKYAFLGEYVIQNPESNKIIDISFNEIKSFLLPEALIIYLYNEVDDSLSAVKIYPEQPASKNATKIKDSPDLGVVQSFLNLKIHNLKDFQSSSLSASSICKNSEFVICIPLFFDQEKIGVIEIGRNTNFDHFEKNTLLTFAQYLTISMRMSGLMQRLRKENEQNEKELLLARELQQSFMPSSKISFGNKQIDFYHRPLREIGGDFYDYFKIDDNHLGIIFGDVSGKGIPAALIVSIVKAYFSGLSNDKLVSPAYVLSDLNKLLTDRIDILHHFVALFYGILDLNSNNMIFSFAGLESPVVIDSNYNIIHSFELESPSVGMEKNSCYNELELKFNKNTSFLLYTDGLSDLFYKTDSSGIAFVLEKISTLKGNLKDRLIILINTHDTEIKDDITLAVIQYLV
ncbi:MAG: SpoIIE family protein phosphatase [Candidatus Hydrogenedentota bacterium]